MHPLVFVVVVVCFVCLFVFQTKLLCLTVIKLIN